MKPFLLAVALAATSIAAMPVHAETLTESFDTDFANWKSRWFGANSNAVPLFSYDPGYRGNNTTGLLIADGDFGPDGNYNGSRTEIRFNAGFAASLRSFSFDILSYNDQLLEFYDLAGNTIFSQQLTPVAGPPFDFADERYTRYTVTSGSGIAGFSLLPFGSEGNVSIDDLVAVTAAVPEPASWATMIAGFGLIGGALRRRGAARKALAA